MKKIKMVSSGHHTIITKNMDIEKIYSTLIAIIAHKNNVVIKTNFENAKNYIKSNKNTERGEKFGKGKDR